MKITSRIVLFLFITCTVGTITGLPQNQSQMLFSPRPASITQSQLWDQTLPLVESLPLTLTEYSTTTEIVNGKNLTIKDVSFESLNLVGAAGGNLTMKGYLILPDNQTGTPLGAVPGIMLLHGLTADIGQTLPWAKIYASHDFIAFCYDHPGHGRSEGPKPNITNFFNPSFVDHYNETSHLYLSNCAALQAIRILENQTGVDKTQLVIGGGSYGGINSMIAGSIYHSKIKAIINGVAAGDFLTSMRSEGKLIRLVAGGDTPTFEAVYAQTKELWDPLYYIDGLDFPPMLTLCGTTDDFFDLAAFNTTYSSLRNASRALSITPNGHHGFDINDSTQFEWLNATLFGGPAVPKITLTSLLATGGSLGTEGEVNFTIASTAGTVAKVEVVYAHVDLLGNYWYALPVATSPSGDFSVLVPAPSLNSRTMIYVRVTTTTGATFTSPVYEITLTNWLTPLIWGLLICAIAIPAALLIRRRMQEIRRAESTLQGTFPVGVRKKSIIDFTCLLFNGINIYLGFALVWVDFSGTNVWTGVYLLNNYFTLFGDWLVPLLLLVVIVGFVLALRFPLLVGIFDLALPILVAFLWTTLTGMYGFMGFAQPLPGPAIVAMLVGAAVALAVGIFRTRYWRPIKQALKHRF